MLIKQHAIIAFFVGLALFYGSLLSAVIFFLSAVLIDGDHILTYWYYTRRFSVISYKTIKHWCLTRGVRMDLYIPLHNVWFFGLLIFLAIKNNFLMPVFFGVSLHFFLDIIWDAHLFFAVKAKKPYRRWLW